MQIASIIGSVTDYGMTILLVEWLNWNYLIANAAGNFSGGSLQFILCRNWAFRAERTRTGRQIIRFAVTFAGSMILSASGVFILTRFMHMNYLISKTLISVLLGITYNYRMQKNFVFANTSLPKSCRLYQKS